MAWKKAGQSTVQQFNSLVKSIQESSNKTTHKRKEGSHQCSAEPDICPKTIAKQGLQNTARVYRYIEAKTEKNLTAEYLLLKIFLCQRD